MNAGRWARLIVTDGTDIIDLLNPPVCLKDWEPAIAQKQEIRQQGFQSGGSIPVDFSWDNINDTFTLNMKGRDGDALARTLQDFHRLLIKAVEYWSTKQQKEPVWIEARAQHETNVRYAHIVSFQTEKDNNPFAQPYFAAKSYRRNFDLGIEHKDWLANFPGDSDCVQVSGTQAWEGSTFGRTATCLDEVYVANKHNVAQLTHIFVDDGGVFGGNLIGAALPFNLLPAVPANNDAVYFGIDTTVGDSGPFCSLVFDIGTVAVTAQTQWESWNGAAWVLLGTQDNTDGAGGISDAFEVAGVNSVHWEHPAAWVTVAVNGVTGYWVRLRVVVAGGGAVGPTQQNRDVYSIVWPHVDIAAAQVIGDFEALARTVIVNQSGGSVSLGANRIIVGLRSLWRGANFSPYINLSDEQNNGGITVTPSGTGAFSNNVETPTGRQVTLTNPGAAWATVITIVFDTTLAPQYRGKFHAYLRGEQTSGAAGDIELRLRSRMGNVTGYSRLAKKVVSFGVVGTDDVVLDFGAINIPPTDNLADGDIAESRLNIEAFGDGVADCNLYDLILMPVDEWIGDYSDIDHLTTWDNDFELDIDGVAYPKNTKRALIRLVATGAVNDIYEANATTPILQANTAQRLWFFIIRDLVPATPYDTSEFEVAGSVLEYANARYLSARGDR